MEFTLTVLGAVLTFVLGQMVIRFLIDPFHNYRALIGRIAHALIFYANASDDPQFRTAATGIEAQRELRKLAGELFERTYAIPWYRLFERLKMVPPRADISKASSELVGMSNAVGHDHLDTHQRRETIRSLLRVSRSGDE